ncbi:hypothetical protein VFPPC_12277 [Pochonia chlamydosporia 170]|uniref:Uncharacterized protein n=1 Tax=Pochonia chlamydosporia 170 TaxID=1380566 RepID=A0A179F0X2_METCM|nr:hypothetical protein VFPPC_12277 [Pochonia chlamydosporia 170]OAQ59071.1 hypothetical protein VFPPC_12277 [Pochonia chlamydosporia 170]
MEPLFRFQSPVAQDPQAPSILIAQASDYQNNLASRAARSTPAKLRENLAAASRDFINGKDFVPEPPAPASFGDKLLRFGKLIDAVMGKGTLEVQDISQALTKAFNDSATNIVKSDDFKKLTINLRDSILAIKFVQACDTSSFTIEAHYRPIDRLTSQLRDLELIQKSADSSPAENLLRYRSRSLQLPDIARLDSILSTQDAAKARDQQQQRALELEKKAQGLISQHRDLKAAVMELSYIDLAHYQVSDQRDFAGFKGNDRSNATALATHQLDFRASLETKNLSQYDSSIDRSKAAATDPLKLVETAGAQSAMNLTKSLLDLPAILPFKSQQPEMRHPAANLRLKPTALAALSPKTQSALQARQIAVDSVPMKSLLHRLHQELDEVQSAVSNLAPTYQATIFTHVGNAVVATQTLVASQATKILYGDHGYGDEISALPRIYTFSQPSVPTTRGKASPAGIADLLVVKQQLKGHEAADLAHIENALKGECRLHEITSTRRTEEVVFSEAETTSTKIQEVGSNSRFEMSQETSNTIKEDESMKAGLQISASYGPFVSVSASVEGAMSRSKEEVTKTASKFAKDITDRSEQRITERTLQRKQITTTTENVDKEGHTIDNSKGTGNVAGVYQWVNKVYEAQVYNYGLRTMFDFMIPEPGAFLIDTMTHMANSKVLLKKPIDLSVTAESLQTNNYLYWAKEYQATDVTPPPEPFITKTVAVNKEGGSEGGTNVTHFTASGSIAIDTGYEAVQGSVVGGWAAVDNTACVTVHLGAYAITVSGYIFWYPLLNGETQSVSWAMESTMASAVILTIQITCRATARAMIAWQVETFGKIMTAYKARLAEYEDKLAQLQLQAGVMIAGKNPTTNRANMQDELKKNCISILTNQHYELFGSVDTDPITGASQIDIAEAEAEGAYARFFEQAFEWEQIMWVTYPYFWGRKGKWQDRLQYDDPDPLFNDFLKAGFCRAMVPARPGFEGAIDHFLTFGELWNGGPLPPISSPLYLPIAEEIAEHAKRPGTEVPVGDPWEVRVPTTLVKLRPDDKLPAWHKEPSGAWVPDA